MRTIVALIVVNLAVCSLSCRKSASGGGSEADAIAKMVMDSQRAGYTKGDFDAFISIWSDDATAILGRFENPDASDQEQTRAQFAARRRLMFQEPPPADAKLEFSNIDCKIAGETATLGYTAEFSFSGFREKFEDRYWLRKTSAGWKVERCRFWIIEMESDGRRTAFDADHWRTRDAAVEKARTEHISALIGALLEAQRFREAVEPARKWTEQEPNSAGAWQTRGTVAMQAGDVDDALRSWRKALSLDPKITVPPYARE